MEQLNFEKLFFVTAQELGSAAGRHRKVSALKKLVETELSAWEREQQVAARRAKRESLKTVVGEDKSALKRARRSESQRERDRRQQKARDAKRYDRDCSRIRLRARERYRNGLLHIMVSGARMRARKFGIPFNLTIDDVHIPEFCPVFGTRLNGGNDGRPSANSPSLDRIVPSLGYVVGNIRVISWRANRLKGDASLEEMEKVVSYMRGDL